MRELLAHDIGRVLTCEPNVNGGFAQFPIFELGQVLKETDIPLLLVDHAEFKGIDRVLLKEKVVIGTRGIWR